MINNRTRSAAFSGVIKLWALVSLCLVSSFSMANSHTAQAEKMVESVTGEMIAALASERARIEQDPNQIVTLVDKILVPHIDFNEIARRVLAQNSRDTTAQQRRDFTQAFSRMVVLVYSTAFQNYTDQEVEILGSRSLGGDGDRVEVRTLIVDPSGTDIPVGYRLVKKNGAWKAYDFNVEGVSLVNNFRTQLDSEIRQKGLDAVIAELKARDARGLQ